MNSTTSINIYLKNLLIISSIIASCEGFLMQPTLVRKLEISEFSGKTRPCVSTSKYFSDPNFFHSIGDQIQFFDDVGNQAAQTFAGSLQSKVIGTIIGNILAGFAFKGLFDFTTAKLFSSEKKVKVKKEDKTSNLAESNIIQSKLPNIEAQQWIKLFICLLIDGISDTSFIIPGIGEFEDIGWAPLSGLIMRYLFDSNTVAMAEFTKEILPFTDIIPFATSVWLLENVYADSSLSKILKLDVNGRSKLVGRQNDNKKR